MPFKPGQSGNPSGRPKADHRILTLARSHAVDAIETLAAIMKDGAAAPAARVSAATHLLDRAYGKPAQAITGADGGPVRIDHTFDAAGLEALDEDELDVMATLLEKAAGAGAGSTAVN